MNELNRKLAEIFRKDFEKKDNNQSVMLHSAIESWTDKMRSYGIRYFCDYDAHVAWQGILNDKREFVVRHPYFTGSLLVPIDLAEKILVLGGLP